MSFYPDIPGRRMVLHQSLPGNITTASGTVQLVWRWRTRDKITITALHGFFATAPAGAITTLTSLKIWAGGVSKGLATAANGAGAGKTAMNFSMGVVTVPANTWVGYAVNVVGATAGGGVKLATYFNHGWNA